MHFAKSGLIGYHFDTNARPKRKGELAFGCLWTFASKSTNSGIQSDEELDAVHTEPETSTNATCTFNGNSSDHRVKSIINDDT